MPLKLTVTELPGDGVMELTLISTPEGGVTVTENPQLAVCPSVDFALTCTGVVPTGKLLPDGGVPVTVIGATPPDVVTV